MTPDSPSEALSAPAGTPRDLVVVHPGTGEVIDLANSTTSSLADYRLELIEAKRALDGFAEDLDVELARRIDLEAVRKVQVGGYDLEVQAPSYVEYDVPRLTIVLEALVQDGRISRGAAERAIKTKVEHSPVQRELNRLLTHADAEVRESVARCRSDVPRTRRRVTVKRAR